MGEIGINRCEYLYDLKFIDLLLIERGYARRNRDTWSASRWSTYNIMAAFVGGNKLAEHGIHGPADLLKLPWDKKVLPMSKAEQESLQAEIAAMNAQMEEEQKEESGN